MAGNLAVSWNEYQKNICHGFGALQQRGEFVDMTLAADGHKVKVHQIMLSLVSPFFKDLITSANCPHPVIFLNGVSYQTMQAILEYAYTGEAVVKEDKIGEFLQVCNHLHIKGLENMLKNVRTTDTHSNLFNELESKRDETESKSENYDILSNSKKRKKIGQEERLEEIAHFVEDDFHGDNVMDEVEVETDVSVKPNNKEDSPAPANENTFKKKPVRIQYSVSSQGNLQIVVNRYLYAFRHMRKNDQRFWRCISQQRTGCPAIVTTFEDSIMERSFPHNHSFHDAQILKRVKNNNMFTSLKDVEDVASEKKEKKGDKDLFQALNETA